MDMEYRVIESAIQLYMNFKIIYNKIVDGIPEN